MNIFARSHLRSCSARSGGSQKPIGAPARFIARQDRLRAASGSIRGTGATRAEHLRRVRRHSASDVPRHAPAGAPPSELAAGGSPRLDTLKTTWLCYLFTNRRGDKGRLVVELGVHLRRQPLALSRVRCDCPCHSRCASSRRRKRPRPCDHFRPPWRLLPPLLPLHFPDHAAWC